MKTEYKQQTGEDYLGQNQRRKSSVSKKTKKLEKKMEALAVSTDAGKKQTRLVKKKISQYISVHFFYKKCEVLRILSIFL